MPTYPKYWNPFYLTGLTLCVPPGFIFGLWSFFVSYLFYFIKSNCTMMLMWCVGDIAMLQVSHKQVHEKSIPLEEGDPSHSPLHPQSHHHDSGFESDNGLASVYIYKRVGENAADVLQPLLSQDQRHFKYGISSLLPTLPDAHIYLIYSPLFFSMSLFPLSPLPSPFFHVPSHDYASLHLTPSLRLFLHIC